MGFGSRWVTSFARCEVLDRASERNARERVDSERGLNINECMLVESVKDSRLNNECLTSVASTVRNQAGLAILRKHGSLDGVVLPSL
jgi:hypothetical protein